MIFDGLRPWIELSIVLWNCGLTATLWMRKPGVDAAKAVNELRDDMDNRMRMQATQITEIRTHMEHMPTTEGLAKLAGTVGQINERTAALATGMVGVHSTLARIQDYLLHEKRT